MNIIKIKDIVMPGDSDEVKFFNENLKGRYAYWLLMRYIVSFDSLSHNGYVRCEEDISRLIGKNGIEKPFPFGVPYWDVYDERIIPYIDSEETDKINNIQQYKIQNKYISDSDITLDEIKVFRTWLAAELLKFDENPRGLILNNVFTEKESHMLEYYKNNMYDNVIKHLNEYGLFSVKIENINPSCGCCGNSDISSLYKETINQCDPIAVYKHNLYSFMVELYSDIEFWTRWPKEFILVFKKYIDNIINTNLPLSLVNDLLSNFIDCNCILINDLDRLLDILKRLSISLNYIAENDIKGHKNYISDSLREWSSELYENMIWI